MFQIFGQYLMSLQITSYILEKERDYIPMSGLLGIACRFVNTAVAFVRRLQDRHVGWLTLNRKTGELTREKQDLWKKFKLLLLFNPVTEWVDRTHLLRQWTHKKSMEAGK